MLSATIIDPNTKIQVRLSGDTPLPTRPQVVPSRSTLKINENYPKNNVTLDEVIEISKIDLNNLTFKQSIIWLDILARKKRLEETRREQQQ